jgi:signal transduction histidine kinase
MRLPFPRRLSGQALAILLCTLAISHLIGIVVYSMDRRATVIGTEARDFTERVAGMVTLLQHLPDEWREKVVRESDGRTFHVTIDPAPHMLDRDMDESLSREVAEYLRGELSQWPPDSFLVRFAAGPLAPATRGTAAGTGDVAADTRVILHISIRTEEARWLNFVGALPDIQTIWFVPASAYILTLAVGVGAVSVWLVFRVTAPLTAFADAADRLGKDIRTEPLPETGPVEVAQAAQAFNAMQKRVRRLVENRTQILGALSHDLRTPVTVLRLRAEQMENAQEREKVLGTLADMEAMIASVLEFTRATLLDETPRNVDLTALIGSICDDLADTGHAVAFDPNETVSYTCGRIGMKRAFTNLIDNAIKYGGNAQVSIARRGSSVVVEVADEGPGIPEDRHNEIFMPFYRVDESRSEETGGVGLGLSITQAIIHGHGGQIQIENRAEGGLLVRVLLPT